MPRGRKKVATEETKKKEPKSPWAKSVVERTSTIKTPVEFSEVVIEKNRKEVKLSLCVIAEDSYTARDLLKLSALSELAKKHPDGPIYWEAARDNYISLYMKRQETDEEVIARLHQKKAELEKLQEELKE